MRSASLAGRNGHGFSLIATLAGLLCAGSVLAQPLQLGKTGSPPPGACVSILKRADDLETQAKSATGPVAALRTLASATLRAAENAAPPQPRSVLWALTLAERVPMLEAVLASLDPAALELFTRDALALASAVPDEHGALSLALRDLFAPLASGAVERSPWLWTTEKVADLSVLDPLAAQKPELAAAVRVISKRLSLAEASPAYAILAAQTRQRLTDAATLAVSPPAWFPVSARTEILGQFADAARRLADEPRSVEPTRRLRRLALLGRIAAALATQRGNTATRAHQAFSLLAAEGPSGDPAARDAEITRLEALVRTAELLPRRDALRDEKRIVRQFRPALRTMLDLARLSEADLLEVLPEALAARTADESVNAPRFVAAVAAHARRLEDVGAIVAASDAILAEQGPPTPPTAEPAAREEFTLLAGRLLAFAKVAYDLGQKSDPATRGELNAALARVRSLADDARDLVLLPGEPELRARSDPAAQAILAALDADREAWLKGWGSPDKHPVAIGERLRRVRRAMILVQDARAITDALESESELHANAWPGWEMRRDTLNALGTGLSDQARDLVTESMDANGHAKLAAFTDRYAPVLLAGRISRLASAARELPFASELTAGIAPPSTAMSDRLADLARVCRESEELAARLAAGGAGSDSLRASVTKIARECLDEAPLPLSPSKPPGPQTP